MLRTFADLGYNVEWRIINAADYGCAQRRRRIFIFAWKKELKYNSKLIHDASEDFQFRESVLAKSFPIDIKLSQLNKSKSINLLDYEDTVMMTDKFSFIFENGGLMVDGIVKTRKLEPKIEKPITMREIREVNEDLSKYFLTQSQITKFEYLKNERKSTESNQTVTLTSIQKAEWDFLTA